MFLCTFLKEHGSLLEKQNDKTQLGKGLQYLVLISKVEDVEIFKICLEYWNALSADLYR
jgi:exportin-1